MYSISASAWTILTATPEQINHCGSLVYFFGYLYALRGDCQVFWRYSISADQWVSLTDTPDKINDGGSLVPLDGRLYALRRDNIKKFWELAASE